MPSFYGLHSTVIIGGFRRYTLVPSTAPRNGCQDNMRHEQNTNWNVLQNRLNMFFELCINNQWQWNCHFFPMVFLPSSLIILCHFVPLLQAPAIHSLLVANLAALRKKMGNSWAWEGWKAMTWDLFGKFRGNPWNPPYVIGRTMVSCGFSPKPIHLCVGRICFGSLSFAFWGYGSIM